MYLDYFALAVLLILVAAAVAILLLLTHVIRHIELRMKSWLNYVLP